jgi:hypothetical protein
MALVRHFTHKLRERYSLHHEIEAGYFAFEKDGKRLLQIDTWGRKSREKPGKQSQTIQLDKDGALELYKILKSNFDFS